MEIPDMFFIQETQLDGSVALDQISNLIILDFSYNVLDFINMLFD